MKQQPIDESLKETPECDCWALTDILDSDKSIKDFDHVCQNTRRVACENWVLGSRLWQLQDDTVFPEIILPLPGQRFVRCGNARWDAASNRVHLSPDAWPYRVNEEALSSLNYDCLSLVIRQWVTSNYSEEYEGDKNRFRSIFQTGRWKEGLSRIRNKLEHMVEQNDDDVKWWAEYFLEDLSLPPGLAQHALHQIGVGSEPGSWSTRLLITSFILKRNIIVPEYTKLLHQSQFSHLSLEEDVVLFEITGSSSFSTTDDLYRKATKCVRAHRNWWRQRSDSRLPQGPKRGPWGNKDYEKDYNCITQTTNDPAEVLKFLLEGAIKRRCEIEKRELYPDERLEVNNSVRAWFQRKKRAAAEDASSRGQPNYAEGDESPPDE